MIELIYWLLGVFLAHCIIKRINKCSLLPQSIIHLCCQSPSGQVSPILFCNTGCFAIHSTYPRRSTGRFDGKRVF